MCIGFPVVTEPAIHGSVVVCIGFASGGNLVIYALVGQWFQILKSVIVL
jgi:hypothetical protein